MQWGLHTHTHKRSVAVCPGLPGWASTRRNIHPLTPNLIIKHPLSASSINYNPCSVCLTVFFHNLSPSPLFFLLVWNFIHFFSELLSSFCSTCWYRCNLSCWSTEIMWSILNLSPNLSLGNLSFTLTPHIHLTIIISARWSATLFSFLTGQVSLPCNMLLHTQLLYNLPVIISDTSLLVSSGTNCLNLFQPIRILASTAASASPSTVSMSPG